MKKYEQFVSEDYKVWTLLDYIKAGLTFICVFAVFISFLIALIGRFFYLW